MKFELDITKEKEMLKRYFAKGLEFVKANPKKSIAILIIFLASGVGYYFYQSYHSTTYYCIDRYAAYKELKRKHKDDIEALQDTFRELAVKYDSESNGKGSVQKLKWDYRDGEWFFNPKQNNYNSGGEDVSGKIKYVDEPCKINHKKRRIYCKIGRLSKNSIFGVYTETWGTSRSLLEGNFEKTVLTVTPHFGGRRDVDVCYIEGFYSPFQSPNIHDASFYGHIDTVKALLAKGTDVNAIEDGGNAALHKAAESGHLGVVKLLISSGADVNLQNKKGRTPLHITSMKRNRKIARFLISKGADIGIKDAKGLSPIDAVKNKSMKRWLESEKKKQTLK